MKNIQAQAAPMLKMVVARTAALLSCISHDRRARKNHRQRAAGGGPDWNQLYQPWLPSTFCSSPLSYISIMMSEPPMNSPFT